MLNDRLANQASAGLNDLTLIRGGLGGRSRRQRRGVSPLSGGGLRLTVANAAGEQQVQQRVVTAVGSAAVRGAAVRSTAARSAALGGAAAGSAALRSAASRGAALRSAAARSAALGGAAARSMAL